MSHLRVRETGGSSEPATPQARSGVSVRRGRYRRPRRPFPAAATRFRRRGPGARGNCIVAQPMHTRAHACTQVHTRASPKRVLCSAAPRGRCAPFRSLLSARYSPRKPPLRPLTDTTRRLAPASQQHRPLSAAHSHPAQPAARGRPGRALPLRPPPPLHPGDPRRSCRAGRPGRCPHSSRPNPVPAPGSRVLRLPGAGHSPAMPALGRGPRESAFILCRCSSCRLL